jgi:hypothetical protein
MSSSELIERKAVGILNYSERVRVRRVVRAEALPRFMEVLRTGCTSPNRAFKY